MKRKLICSLCLFVLLVMLVPNYAFAKCDDDYQIDYFKQEEERGDVIVTKYRIHNGYLQYRHWNETRNCWVEDHWIDA